MDGEVEGNKDEWRQGRQTRRDRMRKDQTLH
jgi:hypothetical protein